MAKTYIPVNPTTDTFSGLITKVNSLLNDQSNVNITTDADGSTGLTTGNAQITGTFTANSTRTNFLSGGNAAASNTMTITSNTVFTGQMARFDSTTTLQANGDVSFIAITKNFNVNTLTANIAAVTTTLTGVNIYATGNNFSINSNNLIVDSNTTFNKTIQANITGFANAATQFITPVKLNITGGLITGNTTISGAANTVSLSLGVSNTFLRTTGDYTVNGTVSFANTINIDNAKNLTFGNSDVTISHNGNFVMQKLSVGSFEIRNNVVKVMDSLNTQNLLTATAGGGVDLYFNNSLKASTTTNGLNVSGHITTSQLRVISSPDDLLNENGTVFFQTPFNGITATGIHIRSAGSGLQIINENSASECVIRKQFNNGAWTNWMAFITAGNINWWFRDTSAKLVANDVGSYVFAHPLIDVGYGGFISGSNLQPTSAAYSITKGSSNGTVTLWAQGALPGTWRTMGSAQAAVTVPNVMTLQGATLFLRVV